MVKHKKFFYLNIILKIVVLLGLISLISQWGMPPVELFISFIVGFILWFLIIFCELINEYQKIKYFYLLNFIGELIEIITFTYALIGFFISNLIVSIPSIIILIFLIICIIASIMGRNYFSLKRAELQGKISAENMEKLREILNISTRIKLERVQNILNLDDKSFDVKIIEWANEFDFKIDGEYLVVNKESVSEFINALDDKFIEWEKIEKSQDGKL